jgi:hypothetical protein
VRRHPALGRGNRLRVLAIVLPLEWKASVRHRPKDACPWGVDPLARNRFEGGSWGSRSGVASSSGLAREPAAFWSAVVFDVHGQHRRRADAAQQRENAPALGVLELKAGGGIRGRRGEHQAGEAGCELPGRGAGGLVDPCDGEARGGQAHHVGSDELAGRRGRRHQHRQCCGEQHDCQPLAGAARRRGERHRTDGRPRPGQDAHPCAGDRVAGEEAVGRGKQRRGEQQRREGEDPALRRGNPAELQRARNPTVATARPRKPSGSGLPIGRRTIRLTARCCAALSSTIS